MTLSEQIAQIEANAKRDVENNDIGSDHWADEKFGNLSHYYSAAIHAAQEEAETARIVKTQVFG